MSLHLEYQSTLGGAFSEINLVTYRVGPITCKFADSHPAVLEFDIVAAQHDFPLALRKYIRFWDDAGTTPDGAAQSSANPLFEGFIWEIQPAESNLLKYVAYDPSQITGHDIPVMSTAWAASVGGDAPLPEADAVPRLILNSAIDNDVDFAFERAGGLTVGEIMQLVLDDAIEPLRWYAAAPGSDVAYQTADTVLFDFIPQEKIVSTNESVRTFLERLIQQYYPEYAFRWDPGTHYWRWYSRLNGTAVTLTLNDPDAVHTVISMELHRSLDGRYPAVKFYGPEVAGPTEEFSTLDGSLSITSPPTILETFTDIHGTGTVNAYTQFQVTDPTKRRGAKRLPATYLVRENDYFWVGTQSPVFLISWDSGANWQGVESFWFDFQHGTANIPDGLYPYFWSDHPILPGSSQHFWTPNAYKIVWAPFNPPLSVRRPSSGFSGTSNSVAGQTSIKHIYDEMLSVGFSRTGIPVATATRVAQYEKLGDAILSAVQDIIYTGGCVLEGLRYEFCRLNCNVNLAAVNHNGSTVTTGWESINAVVSDVEYNFAEKTTTLTFSSEALNALGDNIDLLKQRLKIGLVEKIREVLLQYQWGHFESKYSNKPGGYDAWTGVVYTDRDLYYDSRLGTVEEAL